MRIDLALQRLQLLPLLLQLHACGPQLFLLQHPVGLPHLLLQAHDLPPGRHQADAAGQEQGADPHAEQLLAQGEIRPEQQGRRRQRRQVAHATDHRSDPDFLSLAHPSSLLMRRRRYSAGLIPVCASKVLLKYRALPYPTALATCDMFIGSPASSCLALSIRTAVR